jgi:hypothetical protein
VVKFRRWSSGGTVIDSECLRISDFTNRAWAEHAVGELREHGFAAELDLSGAGGRLYAVIVRGCPEALAQLRPLAERAPGSAPVAACFEWCTFVNAIECLAR